VSLGRGSVLNIVKATRRYETWLATHTPLVKADLGLKHQRMSESRFAFLRATFYRWIQVWPDVCPDLAMSPQVMSVGDLHIENFGTWRDIEGRLVWGVNDFDEAAVLPYTHDLIRLATSALMAVDAGHLALRTKDACAAILDGYRESLADWGCPFLLEEDHRWLRAIALNELRDPTHFWSKMEHLPRMKGKLPVGAQDALEHLLPERGLKYHVVRRVAGLGALGHVRLVAIAECHGGKVAREVKSVVPSAVHWVNRETGSAKILYQTVIDRAVRAVDPFVRLRGRWIVRRLSPHCCRIELDTLPRNHDELRLLFAMGWEAANIHLGGGSRREQVRRHLDQLKSGWLAAAVGDMTKAVTRDWRVWRDS
jgi:hypothetical protein